LVINTTKHGNTEIAYAWIFKNKLESQHANLRSVENKKQNSKIFNTQSVTILKKLMAYTAKGKKTCKWLLLEIISWDFFQRL
jgi:hypothetical protein